MKYLAPHMIWLCFALLLATAWYTTHRTVEKRRIPPVSDSLRVFNHTLLERAGLECHEAVGIVSYRHPNPNMGWVLAHPDLACSENNTLYPLVGYQTERFNLGE